MRWVALCSTHPTVYHVGREVRWVKRSETPALALLERNGDFRVQQIFREVNLKAS